MGQRAESWKAAAEHVPCQCFFPEVWENAGSPAVYDKIYSDFCRYAESFDEELILCGLSLGGKARYTAYMSLKNIRGFLRESVFWRRRKPS